MVLLIELSEYEAAQLTCSLKDMLDNNTFPCTCQYICVHKKRAMQQNVKCKRKKIETLFKTDTY